MALVSILNDLKKAQQAHYGIPSFNTFDSLGSEGIFAALADKSAPGIVAIYTGVFDKPNARPFMAFLRTMAEQAPGPVSLLLDHGANFEHCMQALTLGCTDVMFDGSKLPIEENIANTKLIVRAAHHIGAAVEAELGHVGQGADYKDFGSQRKGFTNPDEVERFVAETGVDFLAIAIGTAHGRYEGEPHLALDLLAEIRRRVDVPLVLHGGSGLSDDQFRAAIAGGICKVNVFTDLAMTSVARVTEVCKVADAAYFGVTDKIKASFQDRCMHYLDVFGASGKA